MNGSKTFNSTSMKSMLGDHQHLLRNGLSTLSYDHSRKTSSVKLLPGPSLGHVDGSLTTFKTRKLESLFTTMNKLVKQKFSFLGGAEKIFRRIFNVREGEQLVRASYCCLSTTAGPIAGRLFISTEKLSFCSDRAIAKVSSPSGEPLRFHYKIVIPLRKIERLSQSENVNKPSQKYLQVVTRDDFEFWFMGFRSYNKTLKCLQLLAQAPKLNLLTSASTCYC